MQFFSNLQVSNEEEWDIASVSKILTIKERTRNMGQIFFLVTGLSWTWVKFKMWAVNAGISVSPHSIHLASASYDERQLRKAIYLFIWLSIKSATGKAKKRKKERKK